MSEIEWLEPWETVDGKTAISLETELHRELERGHPLFDAGVDVLARRSDQDDIAVQVMGGVERFAVVHLTWSGKVERAPDWPRTSFYRDEDELRRRIEKDHYEHS